ncbi:MAG: hypothetical protein V4543_05685 [Bacteroidota bacterium]
MNRLTAIIPALLMFFFGLWAHAQAPDSISAPLKTPAIALKPYKVLVLEHKRNRHIYTEGSQIDFKLNDDNTRYHGIVTHLYPNMVAVNFGDAMDVPLAVTDFHKIYLPSRGRFTGTANTLGLILPLAGALFFGADALNSMRQSDRSFNWKASGSVALICLGAGVSMRIAAADKRYRIGNRWHLGIMQADGFRYRRQIPGES